MSARMFHIGALAIFGLAFGACSSQVRVPDDLLQVQIAPSTQAIAKGADDMVRVHSPRRSFYIDPFEASELGPGDIFSVRNQTPRSGVSREEAAQFCASTGKRLCTLYEWTNACLGTHRRRFSYAAKFQENHCRVNTEAQGPKLTGQNPDCRTDTGLYDMVGNVMEWVADSRGEMAVAVGGSFAGGTESDCFTKFYFPADHRHDQIGFRCCR